MAEDEQKTVVVLERLPPGRLTATAWELPTLSLGEVTKAAEWLAAVGRGWQFWAGDLINAAQTMHGELASQALVAIEDAVGPKSLHTLTRAAWVARAFPPDRRRPGLSYSHHLAVAGLDAEKADGWLDRAERESISAKGLRDALHPRTKEPACRHCPEHCPEEAR